MNQFTEVHRRKTKSKSGLSRQHEREVASARTSQDLPRIRRLAARLLLAAIAVSAAAYFLATASLKAILIAGGVLLVFLTGLVAFGFYVMDIVR